MCSPVWCFPRLVETDAYLFSLGIPTDRLDPGGPWPDDIANTFGAQNQTDDIG